MSMRRDKKSSTPNIDDRQQAEYKRILEDLLKLDDNKRCADCSKPGPKWASVTLGIFLCLDCAGLHRNLGVHISFIRSTSLDTWKPEQVENMRNMGNKKSNEVYESNIPGDYPKPNPGDKIALGNWIRAKYVDKRFMRRNSADQPPNRRQQQQQNQGNVSQPITRRENENVRRPNTNEEFEPFGQNQNNQQNNQSQNNSNPLVLGPSADIPDFFGGQTKQIPKPNPQNPTQNPPQNPPQNNVNPNQEKKSLVDDFMKMFEDQKQNNNTANNQLPPIFGENFTNGNNQQGYNNGQFGNQGGNRVNGQQFGNNQGFGNNQMYNNGQQQFVNQQGNQGFGNNQQGFGNNQQYVNQQQNYGNNQLNNQNFGNQGYGNNQQGFGNNQQFNNRQQQQFVNQQQGYGNNQQQGFGNNQQQGFGNNQGYGNNQQQGFNNQQYFNQQQGYVNNQVKQGTNQSQQNNSTFVQQNSGLNQQFNSGYNQTNYTSLFN